jgi:hypothetical protein
MIFFSLVTSLSLTYASVAWESILSDVSRLEHMVFKLTEEVAYLKKA